MLARYLSLDEEGLLSGFDSDFVSDFVSEEDSFEEETSLFPLEDEPDFFA